MERLGVGGAVALAAFVVQIEDARTLASVSFVVDLALSPPFFPSSRETQLNIFVALSIKDILGRFLLRKSKLKYTEY